MSKLRGVGHEQEIYTKEVFDYDYLDVGKSVVWLALPLNECIETVSDKEYRDFYSIIYGDDYIAEANNEEIYKCKSGRRDIQFLEFFEWKYGCDYLQVVVTDISSYSCNSAKELFPILDAIHIHPQENDAIFDFGCGKGGALTTFLDYGFQHVGGVELDRNLYNICLDNFKRLGIEKNSFEVICGNILDMREELERYNWFYFFNPLPNELYPIVIDNLCESYRRKRRRMIIIAIDPSYHEYTLKTGVFRLKMQLSIDTLKRVCDIFETIPE